MELKWLVDKSALVRLQHSQDCAEWTNRIDRGLVAVSSLTLLEIGHSVRNAQEHELVFSIAPIALMPTESVTPKIESRALEVQRLLAAGGMHRAPSIPDLLIAATAEMTGRTVLHFDKDFELIANVTGQAVEKLVLA